MTSIAAVSSIRDDGQSASDFEKLAGGSLVRHLAVAAPVNAKIAAEVHRLRAPSLTSTAAVCEALRWFESTNANFLLWLVSPRVELSAIGIARLAQAAADSRAAILYSDYFY